jgi:hypothetical protein
VQIKVAKKKRTDYIETEGTTARQTAQFHDMMTIVQNYIHVVYMHKRLAVKGVLKDLLKNGHL